MRWLCNEEAPWDATEEATKQAALEPMATPDEHHVAMLSSNSQLPLSGNAEHSGFMQYWFRLHYINIGCITGSG